MSINVNKLTRDIVKSLEVYTEDVKEEIEISKKIVTKDLRDALKQKKWKRKGGGSYNKGWRIKKEKKSWFVHNATDYQLTHLLEKGHAKIGGGRVEARVHIAPEEQKAVKTFVSRIKKAIKE